jgi:erythronate-4-phosphate dehydrogenase
MKIVADRNIPYVRAAFGDLGQLDLLAPAQITADEVQDADALLVRTEVRVDKNLLDRSSVQFVGTATIGADHIDAAYLDERGIRWANAPGSNADAVKEYVLAALTHLARVKHFSLAGKTIGVVGVGNIGRRVAEFGSAWGMKVLQNDPPLFRATGESRYVPLDALMDADVVTIHVPLTTAGTDPTYHLFDAYRIKSMKPGSILINTSRGAVVDNQALREALRTGLPGGAVLDVWEHEPSIDARLLRLADIGTPHIAGYSLEGKARATGMLYDALCAHFGLSQRWKASSALPDVVDQDVLVDDSHDDPETAVSNVVQQCYPILQDDTSLRAMLDLPEERRGEFFARLRTGYSFRREFSTRMIRLTAGRHRVSALLQAAGFQLPSTSGERES